MGSLQHNTLHVLAQQVRLVKLCQACRKLMLLEEARQELLVGVRAK